MNSRKRVERGRFWLEHPRRFRLGSRLGFFYSFRNCGLSDFGGGSAPGSRDRFRGPFLGCGDSGSFRGESRLCGFTARHFRGGGRFFSSLPIRGGSSGALGWYWVAPLSGTFTCRTSRRRRVRFGGYALRWHVVELPVARK